MSILAVAVTAASARSVMKTYQKLDNAIDDLERRVNRQVRTATMRAENAEAALGGFKTNFDPTAVGAINFEMKMAEIIG